VPKKHLTDEQLAEALRQGDDSALDEIVRRYTRSLTNLATKKLGINPADAEELVNDLFMGLEKKLKAFDCNRNFRRWIRETFKNICMDHHKKEDGRNPEEIPDTVTARHTILNINLDPTAPFDAIHQLSELHSRDPFYSGQGLLDVAAEEKERRLAEKVDERMDELDHPIPDDWEEGLREAIEKGNSFCKATMLELLNDERKRPLVSDAAAILWRAYVNTPIVFREIRVGNC